MHQRPSNNSAKPAAGPDCSVPAMGWAGMRCTPSGTCGPTSRITAAFTDRHRQRSHPVFRCGAISSASIAETADRRAKDDEIGVAHGRPPGSAVQRIGKADRRAPRPASRRRRRIAGDMGCKTRAARGMGDRRADQADADQRESCRTGAWNRPSSLSARSGSRRSAATTSLFASSSPRSGAGSRADS